MVLATTGRHYADTRMTPIVFKIFKNIETNNKTIKRIKRMIKWNKQTNNLLVVFIYNEEGGQIITL